MRGVSQIARQLKQNWIAEIDAAESDPLLAELAWADWIRP